MTTKTSEEIQRKAQLLHATKWTAAAKIINQGISASVTFLLAGLLGPEAFGIVALSYFAVTFAEIVAGMGFNSALVQSRKISDLHLNSVFWLNLGLAFLLMALVWLGSRGFAVVMDTPNAEPILEALAFLLPIQGLNIVQTAAMSREMAFRALAIRSSLGVLTGGIVGLVMAVRGFGAWALVGQHLTRETVSVILIWKQSRWRPGWEFSGSAIKELLGFASKSMVGQFGTFLQNQFDGIMVGFVLGPAALGLYRLAERLVELVLSIVPRALQSVSLAHFSRLQHDLPELNRNLLLGAKINCIATFPALAFLAGASSAVLGVFGNSWIEAAGVLEILALIGAAKAVILFFGPTLQAVSRPGAVSLTIWIGALANVAAIATTASMLENSSDGALMLAISAVRAGVFCGILTPLLLYQVRSATSLSLTTFARTVMPAIGIALVIWLAERVLEFALLDYLPNRFASVTVAFMVGAFIAGVAVRLFYPNLLAQLARSIW